MQSDRFFIEEGYSIAIQVPSVDIPRIMQAVLKRSDLKYGDYDQVAFRSAPGIQQFRVLPEARNAATEQAEEVACEELRFFLPRDELTEALLREIYDVHPYEEPVILISETRRTRHIRGMDDDNPNRFWNRETEDWVPEAHRYQITLPG